MHIEAEAIICSVRAHGEHGAIVRAMTAAHGLLSGYVRGGHSRRLRPVLFPSNVVRAEFRARTEDQLAALTVELIHSRAPLMSEPLAVAALDWTTALTASALPEGQPFPRLHAGLSGVLDAIEAAPSARGWAFALLRYEVLCLAELGFALEQSPIVEHEAGHAEWRDILDGLRLTGAALTADIFVDRRADVAAARERLIERLKRAVA